MPVRPGPRPTVSAPELAHELVEPEGGGAEDLRWTYFLHGIFGAGRNWRSMARRWVDAGPARAGVLADLRLHGDSTGFEPPHTIEACGGDVEDLFAATGRRPFGLLGHSFGGKVALQVAAGAPDGLSVVWIVDSTPEVREPEGDAVRMLGTLRAEPGPFGSRGEAEAAIRRHGFPAFVARWMTTNLVDEDGAQVWRFDLDGLAALLEDFFRADLWPVVEDPPSGVEIHFLRASESGVLPEAACERIEAAGRDTGRVHLHRVEGGHWLHVAAPDEVLAILDATTPD